MTGMRSRRRGSRPALITDAAISHEQELAVRKRRYAIMMGMRIPFLIAAFVFASTPWLAVSLLILSIPLPWMAVLIANDRLPRRTERTHRYRGEPRALGSDDHPVIGS